MTKFIAVIQARMESRRLPEKVLLPFIGRPSLQHIFDRVKKTKYLDDIIVVTSDTELNKPIEKLCLENNVKVYKSNTDVLTKVVDAVSDYDPSDYIIDITADCPLIDHNHIEYLIIDILLSYYDYIANCIKRTWPIGFDLQIYNIKTIRDISKLVTNANHRTHAGWNIYNSIQLSSRPIKSKIMKAPAEYTFPQWRLTLDTIEDYRLLTHIFEHFWKTKQSNIFSAIEIIDYLKKNPELLEINSMIKQKSPDEI